MLKIEHDSMSIFFLVNISSFIIYKFAHLRLNLKYSNSEIQSDLS